MILMVILVLAGLGVGGFFLYKKLKAAPVASQPAPPASSNPPPQSGESGSEDPSKIWDKLFPPK